MHSTIACSIAALAAFTTVASAVPTPVPADGLPARADGSSSGQAHVIPAGNKRRHHEKMANLKARKLSPRALLSGSGKATLYYDIFGGGTCGPANGWSSFPETGGYSMCEPWTNPKTIAQRNSNRIVALPSNTMTGHLAEYCGKEVIATLNGKTISGLIAWDGCAACNENNGLDFSSTIFGELVGEENCGAGKVDGLTWTLTSNQIWDTNGNPVGSGSGSGSTKTTRSTSEWQEPSTSESEQWEEPSTSKWVEPTTSSSSLWVAPSPSKWTEPSSSSSKWTEPESSSSKWTEPSSTKKAEVNEHKPLNIKAAVNLAAQPSTASSTSSSSSPSSTKVSSTKVEEKPTEKASSDKEAAPAATKAASTANTCNDRPGEWKCEGKSLQQCVQTTGDWEWSERVACPVELINCDTPNPVCPAKAACPARKRLAKA